MNALARQHVEISCGEDTTVIVYDDAMRRKAISLAKECRSKKNNTELLRKRPKDSLDVYIQYGKKNGASSLLYLQESEPIEMINLRTGKRRDSEKVKRQKRRRHNEVFDVCPMQRAASYEDTGIA